MFKRIIIVIIIAIFVFSTSATVFSANEETKKYDLELLIDTAIDNNSSLKLYDEKIKIAEKEYNNALKAAKDIIGAFWDSSEGLISNKKIELLVPFQKLSDLDELKWQKQDDVKDLKLDITKLYYQILLKHQSMDAQEGIIKRAQDAYDIEKLKVNLGNAVESGLLPLEIAVDEAETGLASLQREYENLFMNLNIKMGSDIKQDLNLKEISLPEAEYNLEDMEKLVSDVIASAHSVKKLENDRILKEKERNIVVTYAIGELPDEADTLADDITNLDFSIRDEKVAVESKVRTDYNNLLNLKDDMEIKELDYNKTLKFLNIAKSKYDVGLITNLDYNAAQGDVDNALMVFNQAKLNYYIAIEEFKNYITPIEAN